MELHVDQSLKTEKELLLKIAAGDQQAFTVVFNQYERKVYAIAKKLTYSHDMAIEIVQDIFIKIWSAREKLHEVENFGGYLNRIVRNHSLNVLRKMSQERNSNQHLKQHFTEIEDSTHQQLDYNDVLNLLNEALEKLPPKQRTAYTLCHQQGLKYDEAALQMNISTDTVHAHMKQALKKIRAHFKENAVLYPAFFLFLLK